MALSGPDARYSHLRLHFSRHAAMAADRLHGDAQPENHDTSLSAAAATLAYKSFHMTEHA